ncbi:MAG: hypothetical protein D6788_09535 [Planctomycetota bacterium]|nr:MAG: hypothetical protein D6788_09535 [Planctomycetota bacterium]
MAPDVARSAETPRVRTGKVHRLVYAEAERVGVGRPLRAWVLFTDKDVPTADARRAALDRLAAEYDPRAIRRRRLRRTRPGLFDEYDLPVAARYLRAVADTGASIRHTSRWVNGVSVTATVEQLERIAALPFVKKIQPVLRMRHPAPREVVPARPIEGGGRVAAGLDYGLSTDQLAQIRLIDLHAQGFTGAGVVIGILDTGFIRSHLAFNNPAKPLNVLAAFDFVNGDPEVGPEPGDATGQANHGTYILGTLAAYRPGELVGAAFDASYILCKTEDIAGEYIGEEDNYVAGLEFIEANGGDLATASLGYIDWYTQADLDGMTAITTQAVNIATANGLFCINAAGNGGHDADPSTSSLIAPADAFQVITCGAVRDTGDIASFSSDGPTADGRVKPEVLARGVQTQTVSPFDDAGYLGVSGTSLSTPLVAGAVACLIQAHPDWTVDQMRERLFHTAGDYLANGTFDPLFVRGYGIIDALAASTQTDCNGNGVDDAVDIANGTSLDRDGNGVPDECQSGACCLCGPGGGCLDTHFEDCATQGGAFTDNVSCSLAGCDGVPGNDACADALPIADGLTPFDTRCATGAGPDTVGAACSGGGTSSLGTDVWFTYTASCTGWLRVEAVQTDFDAYVAVYCNGSSSCVCPTDGSTEYACGADGVGLAFDLPVDAGNCYTIRVGSLDGLGGRGMLDVSCAVPGAPPPPPDSDGMEKNRYLTLSTADARVTAWRVTFVSLPPPFDAYDALSMWVGPPQAVSENAGTVDPAQGGRSGVFLASTLQCDPFFADWSSFGTVEVSHALIVPGAVYAVEAVEEGCDRFSQPTACFSGSLCPPSADPLSIRTSLWGDVTGGCSVSPCTPPDGQVDVVTDLLAVLEKFRNAPGAPPKARADLEPAIPDRLVNISDALVVLDAFRGFSYPFSPPAAAPCGE